MTKLPFAAKVERDGDVGRVVLQGELDLAGVPTLEDALHSLEGEGTPTIVLDLSELNFLDSSGLRAVLSAHDRARERGHRLVVVQGGTQVERVLRVTGVERHLEIVEDSSKV
jgi:anti-anti-sigma factor